VASRLLAYKRRDGVAIVSRADRGVWYAAGAYGAWGILPAYWKLLHGVPALQVISHRILWSFVILSGYLVVSRQWYEFRTSLAAPGVLRTYSLAALLIAINWAGFIWAVNAGFIVETSLGYFINPLLSVLLGVLVLGERLRPLQWLAVALASAGVLHIAISHGQVPWISLLLATSFALYALVKKRAPLGSLHGLALETGLLLLPSAGFLLWSDHVGEGAFLRGDAIVTFLLLFAGVITTVPLLLFASAAQSIPMLWLGILQYIAPTLQLALGVLVYGEPFTRDRFVGFALVWAALAVFAIEGVAAHRAAAVVAPPE
jgi:chloramphenicol-sensitive protein RarD